MEADPIILFTSFPSGKQRQKKSGRGRPTASLIASVTTPVKSTAYRRPICTSHDSVFNRSHTNKLWRLIILKTEGR